MSSTYFTRVLEVLNHVEWTQISWLKDDIMTENWSSQTFCFLRCCLLSAGRCSLPFPLWPRPCGVTTAEASITQQDGRRRQAHPSQQRGEAVWIGSCLLRCSEDSGGLFEITMQSRPCCQVFNDTQICEVHTQRGLFFPTLLLTSKTSYQTKCVPCPMFFKAIKFSHKHVFTSFRRKLLTYKQVCLQILYSLWHYWNNKLM